MCEVKKDNLIDENDDGGKKCDFTGDQQETNELVVNWNMTDFPSIRDQLIIVKDLDKFQIRKYRRERYSLKYSKIKLGRNLKTQTIPK